MKSESEKIDKILNSVLKNRRTSPARGALPVVGAIAGRAVGRHVGLAVLGTAISGALPFAIIGGLIGLLLSGLGDD
jgi:hypothetical protein